MARTVFSVVNKKRGEEIMAKGKGNTKTGAGDPAPQPSSLDVSRKGVRTGHDFANLMSNVMSDLIDGTMEPQVAHAVCNAGGKLLKVVEMQHKYGSKRSE
jgi:hypothetical protein